MEKILEIIDIVVNALASSGYIGGFFLVFLESMLPILPLDVFIALNIMSFGKVPGLVLSYFASLCGCMTVYFIFKYFIQDHFRNFVNKKDLKKLNKLIEIVDEVKLNVLVVLIAIPFTPAFLVNIAAGISKVSPKKYFLALLLGKPVMIYFGGYIGTNIFECFRNPMVLLEIILVTVVVYIISKFVGKVLKIEV